MTKNLNLGAVNSVNQASQTNQASGSTSNVQNTNQAAKKISFQEIKKQDWFRIVFSIVVSSLVYFLILSLLPEFAEFWHRHAATYVLSILVFMFIGFAQKEPGTLGDAIVSFLTLILCLNLAIYYLQ